MLSASLYIIVCTARNRLRAQLRRLREPRYLIGALAGGAYLYFSVFARMRAANRSTARRRARTGPVTPILLQALYASGPALTGTALLLVAAASWLMPVDSGLLEFSQAEVQFLFPAPITRRKLLIHRLLRSQVGLLFGSVIVGFVSPLSSGYGRLQIALGMWLLLLTMKVYFTGITLSRASMASPQMHLRRRAWLPILLLAAGVGIVGVSLTRAWMGHPHGGPEELLFLLDGVSSAGASRIILWPFVAIARPLFSPWPGPFFRALGSSALVFIAVTAWVLRSDEAFQDAAATVTERRDRGQLQGKTTSFKARATGLTLGLSGRPELAFAWKAAIETLRVVDRRALIRLASIIGSLSIVGVSIGRTNGLAAGLGMLAVLGLVFSVLMAPQALRIDLRQDLRHLEVLKTWPVRSSAVVRGEMIWPGTLTTAIAWISVGLALFLSSALLPTVGFPSRFAFALAVAIVSPALIFAQFTIHNGVALLFPAWVPLGSQRSRGLDALGQRLIMLGGTWLLLLVMTLPGAVAGGIIWFAFRRLIGVAVFVPAAIVCAIIVAVEVLVASEALGPAYERLDLTAVERAE